MVSSEVENEFIKTKRTFCAIITIRSGGGEGSGACGGEPGGGGRGGGDGEGGGGMKEPARIAVEIIVSTAPPATHCGWKTQLWPHSLYNSCSIETAPEALPTATS